MREKELLDFDLGAGGFDLFLDLFRFFLGDTFLEGLWSALNEGLCFCEAEACDSSANFLNDRDLVATGVGQDDIKRGLFFDRGSCCSTCTGSRDGYGSGGANTPLVFELLNQVSDFKDGKSAELIHECCCICHSMYYLVSSRPEASGHLRPAAADPTRNLFFFG